MKAFTRISLVSFFFMILFLPTVQAETLQEQLNNLVGPKQKYNTMLSPVYLRNNETVDQINPQSGTLTVTQTDYVLPGRNGLDLEFKRIYKNESANVQEMEVEYIDGAWVDKVRSNASTSSFYEDRYNLGIGMRFSFPNMEINKNEDGTSHKFLHTESGDVYRLKPGSVDGSFGYLPEGQTVKDVVVRESVAYQNGQADGVSKYVMKGKDGKSTYFAEDGRILGIVDRYGNTIRFEYSTLNYEFDYARITKKLISKITDSVGRVTTIEYVEDASYKVSPIGSQPSLGKDNYYQASQNPNSTDSGELNGKFKVILHLPGEQSIVYDKSAALTSSSKHVIRTRLQRVYDTDSKPKYLFWYEQPDLGFTYFNKENYSAYVRYENLVLIDAVKTNSMKRYTYNTYTKRLNEGSMQYRKIFESRDLVKKGFDPAAVNFLDKYAVDVKNKNTYTYTNEADGYGTADYKEKDDAYLKETYKYYTQITDANSSTTKFTYNGKHELVLTEKQGKNHKEAITNEHDEMKLVKKQETLQYQVTGRQAAGEPVKKIENYRYDEYGNMTSHTGPDAQRDAKGYPINNERTVLYTYDISKFHVLTQKTWKQDENTTAQINYELDTKGNVIKESKSNNDSANSWTITEFAYDSYGNLIRKTAHDKQQDFITRYEYGTDANGVDTKGAYLTKQYQQLAGKTYAQTYAYDFQTGNVLSEIDQKGNKTSYLYDALSRVVKNTKPDNSVQEYQYLENGFANFRIQLTDANKNKFLTEYDIQGNQLNSKVLLQGTWKELARREYDSFGNLSKEIDGNGHGARYTYDSQQQIVEKSYYENDKTLKGTLKVNYQIGADAKTPLLLTITNEEGYEKRSYYDISDQLVKQEVTPDRQKYYASTTTYDYMGNVVMETDEGQRITRYTYDTQGNKTSQTDALGNKTEYAYNVMNQPVMEKAPGGKITEWTYDELGRNTIQKLYLSGSPDYFYTRNEYDEVNNLVQKTMGLFTSGGNRDSSSISYAYNPLKRVTDEYSRLDADSTTHIHTDYDGIGNKVKVIEYGDSAGTKFTVRSFEYDFAGRVTLEGGSAKEKSANGTFVERGQFETKNVYDLFGNLLKKQIFNGKGYDTEENTYNYRNLIASNSSPFNTKGAKRRSFQYDKVGNLITEIKVISGTERTTSYTYDGLGYKTGVIDPLGNITRYQYDNKGNLIKIVDPRYHNVSMKEAPGVEKEYDLLNRLVKTTAFDGTDREVMDYREYDERGNVIKQSDGEGYNVNQPEKSIGTEYRYNVLNKPVLMISAQTAYVNQEQSTSKSTKSLTYDGSGNVVSETDGLDHTTRFAYDLGGRLKQIIYADGTSTSTEYDYTGKWIISSKDQAGKITRTFNNVHGKPYLIEYPDGTRETFRYSAKGEVLERVNKDGNSTYYTYDLAGNQITEKAYISTNESGSDYRLTRVDYDEASNLLAKETFLYKVSKSAGAASETSANDRTEQSFDKAGRLVQLTGPFGKESKQEYDRAGNVVTSFQKISEGNYDITRNTYDSRSRLTKTALLVKTSDISSGYLAGAVFDNEYVDRLQAVIGYAYYKNDQVKSTTDAKGNITLFDYDYDKHTVKKTDPLKGATAYKYDNSGNLIAETDPKGVSTLYEYDAMKRLLRKNLPAADGERAITRYVYDLKGNLIKEVSPNQYLKEKDSASLVLGLSGISYTYDTMNRRIAKISPEGLGLEYIQYDEMGQVSKVVDGLRYSEGMGSSKGTTYLYDGLGRMVQETNALGHSKRYEYGVLEYLLKQADGRGNITAYTVNPDGTPSRITNADGGVIKYEYDKLGRKISETNPLGATTVYSYNAFGKEKSIKDPNGYIVDNKYDPNGNLISVKDKRGSLTLYNYDAMNQLTEKKTPLELDESKNVVYAIESYAYDSVGNMLKKTLRGSKDDADQRETTYIYYDNKLVKTVADNSGASASSEYDKNGNLIRSDKLRDTNLLDVEQYEYDSQNRQVKKTAWLDETSVAGASSLPNLAGLKSPEFPGKIAQITSYGYDILGNKIQELDARVYGFLSTDTANRKLYTLDFTYDALNRPDKIIRRHGTAEVFRQYGYDAAGNKNSDRNEWGAVTRYSYDAVNRLTVTTDPEGKKFTTGYDTAGNKIADTNAQGYKMSYTYDKLNRLVLTMDPNNIVIGQNIYDANSNIIKKIEANGYAAGNSEDSRYGNSYLYDLANRMVEYIDPVVAAKSGKTRATIGYQYNAYDNLIKQTDALGIATQYEYDNAGRLSKVTDGEGIEVSYGYDRMGNKLFMKDGRGKVTQYKYSSFGLLQAMTDASNHTIYYGYDLAHNKTQMTDRMGHHTQYAYDNRNLLTLTKVEETGDQMSYSYDEAGNRIRMVDESGTSVYSYNSLNQLLKIVKDDKAQVGYTYDALGNIATVEDASGFVTTYQYDKSSRMQQVVYDNKETIYTYDKSGNRTVIQYEDEVKETFSYDQNNRLLSLINKRDNGSEISSYRYTYDDAGRQTSKTDSYGITKYSYDQAGRIKQVETPGKTTIYVYDGAGNRMSMLETYTSLQPSSYIQPDTKKAIEYKLKKTEYLYSSSNQLMKLEERMSDATGKEVLFKAVDYLYDGNGNEVSQKTGYIQPHTAAKHQSTGAEAYRSGETETINSLIEKVTQSYDGFNRLKKTIRVKSGDRVTVEYGYNGDGLRTKKTVRSAKAGNKVQETNYSYDRQHVILETNGAGKASTRYIRGINYIARMDQAKKYAYYLYNGHGDVVQTVTPDGEVQNQYEYDAFGNPVLTIEVYEETIRYGGEHYDAETSLYYLRARYYDPNSGRFVSEDSYWGEDNNPLSLNLYTYAHNDPIRFLDPTGHWVKGDDDLNVQAQAQIIALTNAWYKAPTTAQKKAISAQAQTIREDKASKQDVATPLKIQGKAITKIVTQGTTKGYADANQWDKALKAVGIDGTYSHTTRNDVMGSISSEKFVTQTNTVIGRTTLSVYSDATVTQNVAKGKEEQFATAALNMTYNITNNEYLFVAEMDLESVEKTLYILDSMIANKGKATKEILNDKTLSIKGVEMLYDINYGKGLSLYQAMKLHEQEVENPKRAEAWGLLGIKAFNGGFGFQTKQTKSSKATVVKDIETPSKPASAANSKSGNKVTEGTGEVPKVKANTNAGNYLANKAPNQVTPGTRELSGQYVDDLGRVQPWKAYYDEYGRLTGRTDYNAGNKAQGIPDTHYHKYEWGPGKTPYESKSHIEGEYKP